MEELSWLAVWVAFTTMVTAGALVWRQQAPLEQRSAISWSLVAAAPGLLLAVQTAYYVTPLAFGARVEVPAYEWTGTVVTFLSAPIGLACLMTSLFKRPWRRTPVGFNAVHLALAVSWAWSLLVALYFAAGV
jgi:hypothetical protein